MNDVDSVTISAAQRKLAEQGWGVAYVTINGHTLFFYTENGEQRIPERRHEALSAAILELGALDSQTDPLCADSSVARTED